ncbi:MBL fold metallo-hydrolase [Zunongwangia sp. SCSIO 43204]|uniref:MBL fold metallo-hydrolase n=1 Tax=Zunongwangia sp. SCSIO 43204 TaxID=2779359 RepID=UPI001CA99C7D|nr:MBL fold metallo-hydrolase [Zunongwangia sp. SCSIO 43204]UAB82942.1 MBL fold metallo-hydrolase [Zunongwangia sp. SCSIO 43204]
MKVQLIRNATMIVEYAGKRMLVDPMFAKKGELARGPMPAKDWNWKRNPNHDLPISVEEILKDIDFVFLTHLHFDHWDEAAANALPKDIKVFVQDENDKKVIAEAGFTNLEILGEISSFGDIKLTRTKAKHGKGFILKLAGQVCGMVMKHPSEKTLYIAADTVWYEEVDKTIQKFNPEVIIVNGGDNRFVIGDQLIMSKEDIYQTHLAAPNADIVVVHMEGVYHNTLTRKELRSFVNEKAIEEKILIPEDGETLSL